jgi:hypothetical protein
VGALAGGARQDGLAAVSSDEKHGRFLQQAINALADAAFYPAPVFLQLAGFQEIKAAVLQVTRSPGKKVVYRLPVPGAGRVRDAVHPRAPSVDLDQAGRRWTGQSGADGHEHPAPHAGLRQGIRADEGPPHGARASPTGTADEHAADVCGYHPAEQIAPAAAGIARDSSSGERNGTDPSKPGLFRRTGLLPPPQHRGLALRRPLVAGSLYAFGRFGAYMDYYEKAVLLLAAPTFAWLGWHWKPVRLLMVVIAVLSLGAIAMYGGALSWPTEFFLKYLLSSQSAILWMSALFCLSTLFYWAAWPPPVPAAPSARACAGRPWCWASPA